MPEKVRGVPLASAARIFSQAGAFSLRDDAARAVAHRVLGQRSGHDGLGQGDRNVSGAAQAGGERGRGGSAAGAHRRPRLSRSADYRRLTPQRLMSEQKMAMRVLLRVVGCLGGGAVLEDGLAGQPAAAVKSKPQATAAVEPPATPSNGIETEAKHAVIIEEETGAVLLDKGAHERIPPASMSKIMTAYVAFGILKEGR